MKKLKNLILLFTLLSIFGCSTKLDPRPEIDTSAPGVMFFGEVHSIHGAKRGFSSARASYGQLSGELLNESANYSGSKSNFSIATLKRSLGFIANVIGIDIEQKVNTSVCLYVIKTADKDILDYLKQQNLGLYINNDVEDEEQANVNKKITYSDKIRKYFTMAQNCNPNIKPNDSVMMSINFGGTTIHEMSPSLQVLKDSLSEVN